MTETPLQANLRKTTSYQALHEQIEKIFTETRLEIENLKLLTYWQTGHLLHQYLEKNEGIVSEASLLEPLGEDLNLERSALFRALQFRRSFPKGIPTASEISWSHVKELLGVPDEVKRKRLLEKSQEAGWPVRRLRLEIQKERGPKTKAPQKPGGQLTEPERREPGVCRIKSLETLLKGPRAVVDLGFELYEPFPIAGIFNEDDTVKWNHEKQQWVKEGSKEDLYYYYAVVERVVDGDTLLVHIQVGTKVLRRQYLRLRGINAEELETPRGKKAQAFLLREVKKADRLLIRTRLTDKYDRFIADVWCGGKYLNQSLLDAGLASKV